MKTKLIKVNIFLILITMLVTGCNKDIQSSRKPSLNLKIAYIGELYEAPLFVAEKKKFFKNSGLDIELVKVDRKNLEQELLSGKIDGVTADYSFLKYIENGIDFKLVSGIQSFCMKVITLNNKNIKDLRDLKGKTIAVEDIGNVSMTVLSLLLRENGIDPNKEIKWDVHSREDIEKLLSKGEIDAAALEQTPNDEEKYKAVYNSSTEHSKYMHFYNSFIALSSNILSKEPQIAQTIAIEWLKAAKWVQKNANEAVFISTDNGYVKGDNKSNSYIFSSYMWAPSVKNGKENVKILINEQRESGLLKYETNGDEFVKKSFVNIIPDF